MSKSTAKKPRSNASSKSIWSRATKSVKPSMIVTTADETDSARAARQAVFGGACEGLRSVLAHQRKTMGPGDENGKVRGTKTAQATRFPKS